MLSMRSPAASARILVDDFIQPQIRREHFMTENTPAIRVARIEDFAPAIS